jgi:hypothetical protein
MSGRIRSLGSTFLAAAALAAPAAAAPAPPAIVTGQDAGWPDVRGFDRWGSLALGSAPWGTWQLSFAAYPTYQKGVRVAVGDVDGDGRAEIVTAPGREAFTEIRVFDGRTFAQKGSVLPFRNAVWWNGAFVTTGDTDGDGRDEIVDGLDAGCCTTLHVLDATSGADRSGFFPYGNRSEVGARVAAADVNGDGRDELFAVPVGGRRVSLYGPLGGDAFRSFEPFGAEAGSGVTIAAGDVLGDSRPELVAAAATGAGVEVRVVDLGSGRTLATYRAFEAGVSPEVAVADVDGDGHADLVVLARLPDGTKVRTLDSAGALIDDFYVLDATIGAGASLAAGDLDGDRRAEIVLGGGPTTSPWPPAANGPDQRVAVYRADGSTVGSFGAYPGLFQGGVRVALGDVDGDRVPEAITGPGPGMEPEIGVFSRTWADTNDRGTRLAHFLAFEPGFRGGVNVAAGDLDGDGANEIVVGAGPGRVPEVRVFDRQGRQRLSFLAFEPGYIGGVSVGAGDLDADGRAELVVGTLSAPARIRTFDGADPLGPMIVPFPGDDRGVRVAVADPAGTGRGLVLAASAAGDRPIVALIDRFTGAPLRTVERALARGSSGLYVAAGDLDRDGRDEVVLTPGWGGGATVHVLDGRLVQRRLFVAYPYEGFGTSVATAARLGLPVVAYPQTPRIRAGIRTRMVVARFRDAAGTNARGLFRATIEWGDGGRSAGVVIARGGGFYDVRGTKRYGRRRAYAVTVRLVDLRGRESIARSTVRVR